MTIYNHAPMGEHGAILLPPRQLAELYLVCMWFYQGHDTHIMLIISCVTLAWGLLPKHAIPASR